MKYNVVIIGAGPAGLTAALFASRAGLKVLCLEKLIIGGQASLIPDVENFPTATKITGFELMDKIKQQAERFETKFTFENVVGIKKNKTEFEVKTNSNIYTAEKVIIACGCKTRKLGLDKEQELTGKGISYCASCDGGFFKDKVVAIVGGGNTAMQDAEYLSRLAKKVVILNRSQNFKADAFKLDQVKKLKNVKILTNAHVTKILGDEKLEAIQYIENGVDRKMKVDGLFVAIGQYPEVDFIYFDVAKDKQGYLIVDKQQQTSVNNLFACGDIVSKHFRQIITACSDGAVAGDSCTKGV